MGLAMDSIVLHTFNGIIFCNGRFNSANFPLFKTDRNSAPLILLSEPSNRFSTAADLHLLRDNLFSFNIITYIANLQNTPISRSIFITTVHVKFP